VHTVPVPSDDVDELAAAAGPVFAADERVRFAYVFGSVAAGTDTAHSDIDLGVSVQPRGTLLDDARLQDALAVALGREDVDLVVLEDAPLWIRYRIVGGRPVFSRDDVARVRHRAATELAYLDFKPYRDVYLAAVHERARAGRLSRG
jgi:predicted nucleotidyltransferase